VRLVLLVALGVAIGAGTIALASIWFAVPDRDLVRLQVELPSDTCKAPEMPMLVEVRNRSKKTLRSLVFSVSVFERGDSTDLSDEKMAHLDWTTIVAPGETKAVCYALSLRGRVRKTDAVASAQLFTTSFYADGDVIPR